LATAAIVSGQDVAMGYSLDSSSGPPFARYHPMMGIEPPLPKTPLDKGVIALRYQMKAARVRSCGGIPSRSVARHPGNGLSAEGGSAGRPGGGRKLD
jgi:hypothetical protein